MNQEATAFVDLRLKTATVALNGVCTPSFGEHQEADRKNRNQAPKAEDNDRALVLGIQLHSGRILTT